MWVVDRLEALLDGMSVTPNDTLVPEAFVAFAFVVVLAVFAFMLGEALVLGFVVIQHTFAIPALVRSAFIPVFAVFALMLGEALILGFIVIEHTFVVPTFVSYALVAICATVTFLLPIFLVSDRLAFDICRSNMFCGIGYREEQSREQES